MTQDLKGSVNAGPGPAEAQASMCIEKGRLSRNGRPRQPSRSPSSYGWMLSMAGMCKWLSNELITARAAADRRESVLALGLFLCENARRKEMGQEKVPPMGTGSVCKASPVWRRPQRVDRGRKLDLGSNGFMQQLPFYVLFPKSPITEQGLYPNLIFFLPSWICRKMTQCWGEWGFLAFPHASESFYSDMLILQVIWSAQGNINNIYSKSCTLSVMCKRPTFPIATWKWEIQMGPFRLSCSATIRQCQLRALASPVLQELESDGGGE